MVEVSQAIVVTEPSQGQKSPEVELRPATTNVLMADDPIATEVQGVLTVFDLLAETEPTVEQLGEEPTRFEFEQPVVVLSISEMTDPFVEMGRKDDQLVLPWETVESAVPLTTTAVDKPISEEPIQ